MMAAFVALIGLPLLLIAAVALVVGIRPFQTIAASMVGAVAGLYLYAAYNNWKVAAILSGKASGAVIYAGTDAPRNQLAGLLVFLALGAAIGLLVVSGHWLYKRARSA
jgi:hypothetical protein